MYTYIYIYIYMRCMRAVYVYANVYGGNMASRAGLFCRFIAQTL